MTMPMKMIVDDVTRVSDQLYVKATTMAPIKQAVNSIRIPSFSDMPTCKVLAAAVIVPAALPGGAEYRHFCQYYPMHEDGMPGQEMERSNVDMGYGRGGRTAIQNMDCLHEQAPEEVRPYGSGYPDTDDAKGEFVDIVQDKSRDEKNKEVQRQAIQDPEEIIRCCS